LVNFEKLSAKATYSFGSQYDVNSCMHYGGFAFARNRRNPVITVKETGDNFYYSIIKCKIFD